MDRREFLSGMGTSMAISVLPKEEVMAWTADSQIPAHKPNVVLFICDDLGFGDLGCYGSKIRTPNLDALAASGMRMTNYCTANPICSASRAAMLTGLYPQRVGAPGVFKADDTDGMALDATTMANMLHSVGYTSACIGKWHLGRPSAYLPTNRGFDQFYGVPWSVDMEPFSLIEGTDVIEPETDRDALTPRQTARAVQFIRENKDKPFFAYYAFSYPHIPIHASARFRGKSSFGIYGDAVEEIDWAVGEVVGELDKLGIRDNTLILFTSDHGPWFQGSTGLLRGRKGMTYEGGVRVPFIINFPGHIPPGRTCDLLISEMDVMPTVAHLAGASAPQRPYDGLNAWPVWSGAANVIERKPLLYFDHWNLQCARWNGWKLHIARYDYPAYTPYPDTSRKNYMLTHPELYDLANDPTESYDVAHLHPDIVSSMLGSIHRQLPSFPAEVQSAWQISQNFQSPPSMPADSLPLCAPQLARIPVQRH
jgi:arylsulfatase